MEYVFVPLKNRSAEVFARNPNLLEVDGNQVSHQLADAKVSGGVTCTPFASIFFTTLGRFYKAFDVVEIFGQDYVISCVIVVRVNATKRGFVVLHEPVVQWFDGNHDNLRTRLLRVEECMEFPVKPYSCALHRLIPYTSL